MTAPRAWTPRERAAKLAISAEYKSDAAMYQRAQSCEWIDEADALELSAVVARLVERNERLKRVPGEMG